MTEFDMLEAMSDLDLWALLVGFLLPPIVTAIKQPEWSKPLRTTVAVLLFLVAGFVTVYLMGILDWSNLVRSILIISVAAYTFYRNFWKPSGIDLKIYQKTSAHYDVVEATEVEPR